MAKLGTQIIFFCVFFILFSSPATSQEVEDESEFNYDSNGGMGPDQWGELNTEWHACKNGTMQSPIDLLNDRVVLDYRLGILKRKYKPSNSTLKNRGHDIMLKWEGGAGSIVLNRTKYELKQVHWHSPSEHTINEKSFDLEAHLVHESKDGKIAVIGILYRTGRPDSFLASLEDELATITDTSHIETVVGVTNPRKIKIGGLKYYRYVGSLTVPPCTEGVLWTIVKKVCTRLDISFAVRMLGVTKVIPALVAGKLGKSTLRYLQDFRDSILTFMRSDHLEMIRWLQNLFQDLLLSPR